MKYLIYVSMTYVAKNKLQKEIQAYFKTINHTLHDDLDSLKRMIVSKINALNVKHYRCKSVEVHFMKDAFDLSIICSGIDSLSFSILLCKNFKN